MKIIYFFAFLFSWGLKGHAQKFILLDKRMVTQPKFSNTITLQDKIHNLIPIEKKYLPELVKSLEEISELLKKNNLGKPKKYEFGCDRLIGDVVHLQGGDRLDYVLTATCNNINIEMHLSDAQLENKNNLFFINTWIKYIKNNIKY